MPPKDDRAEEEIGNDRASEASPTPESETPTHLDEVPSTPTEDERETPAVSPDYEIEAIDDEPVVDDTTDAEGSSSPLDPDALEDRLLAPDPGDPAVDEAFEEWEDAAAGAREREYTGEEAGDDDLESIPIVEALPDRDGPSLGYNVEFTEPIKPSVAALRMGMQQRNLPTVSRDRYFSPPQPKEPGHLAHRKYNLKASGPPAWKLRLDAWRAPSSWSQTRMLSVAVGLALGVVLLLILGIAAC